MKYPKYIEAEGVYLKEAIQNIKKKDKNYLQPFFEAITNSIEAIKILNSSKTTKENGEIVINLFLLQDYTGKIEFDRIEISDNGIGFNDTEFKRFCNLRDNRKRFFNKGTGRIQFLHYFKETKFFSVFKKEQSYYRRRFVISKEFLKTKNGIIRLDGYEKNDPEKLTIKKSHTTITFKTPLDIKEREKYEELTVDELKEKIIHHYIAYFCEHKRELPKIIIRRILIDSGFNETIDKEETIRRSDIPEYDKDIPVKVNYCRLDEDDIVIQDNFEEFLLKSFIIPKYELNENALFLVSKGELAKTITLENLLSNEDIDNQRYLFLLSGEYLNKADGDTRGEFAIHKRDEFIKLYKNHWDKKAEIILEDIEDETNKTITENYPEISERKKKKERNIEELRKMFLLNEKTVNSVKIRINDSDDTILKKIYKADADISARYDAELKHKYELLNELDPTDNKYQEKLKLEVNELVKCIPLQNRTSLSQYVARRNLVLKVFDKILKRELEKLRNGGRIDEDLLHNLIFQQSSEKPEDSDLWLINEEFIYFKGFSEKRLYQIKIDGNKIFDKKFSEEEERYLNSLGEKRLSKRPDVLLFPKEGKCIIIEFKAPDVNVSEHITQIDFYANLIRNYTIDQFQITTFYAYLIGEGIEDRDVRGRVTRFEHSYHFDYWFRPSEKVVDFSNIRNGSIYTEIIKYSTLLDRAQLRNQIFIDKLEGTK